MESTILTPREIRRYSKQIMMPEIGLEGQEKIKQAKILVIGAGGLGCPVLQYLAAAGFGRIGIVEFDKVDESNLQRQVLYGSMDVGKLKAIIAKNWLEQLNILIDYEIFNLKLEASNALKIIKNFDIIVDATDNLATRYLINDACVILNKPMVHGAIFRFEGQVSVFNYMGGPTYRCYNPGDKRTDFKNPRPADVGLMGVLPGITGTIMANEVIKIITGTGTVLRGKLLLFNIQNYSFRIFNIDNVPGNHDIHELRTEY
jgi:molybdopterin/thiamine biosynthesis adenylyltransferase